jgi:cholesterol oxidase
VSIHLWSFRAPDPVPPRTPQLLPGAIKGISAPEISEIELEPPRHGKAVVVRLTRYRGRGIAAAGPEQAPSRPPLVMIHGYSASGTTFTHEAIPEPMARYFWSKGRDVWILDLRTSAGMPSAMLPWNFEDAALADIPVAIARIRAVTNAPAVDVFAHCIGAVMLSMGLLTDPDDAAQMQQIDDVEPADGVLPRRYPAEVRQLKESIRKIVLSQKGPVPVYSDGNVLRAYLTRVLRSLVLPENYQFRVPQQQSLAGQGLDRLLSSLPYPDDELFRENPLRPCATTPWAGFRHRMDALYARDFSLRNISNRTLEALEDLFGPLNLDTVSQAVHFARYNMITNGAGRNCFVSVSRMRDRWPPAGTLAIHGEENGLADIRTLGELSNLMAQAPELKFQALPIRRFGHQDCLIGIGAREAVLDPVEEFLSS